MSILRWVYKRSAHKRWGLIPVVGGNAAVNGRNAIVIRFNKRKRRSSSWTAITFSLARSLSVHMERWAFELINKTISTKQSCDRNVPVSISSVLDSRAAHCSSLHPIAPQLYALAYKRGNPFGAKQPEFGSWIPVLIRDQNPSRNTIVQLESRNTIVQLERDCRQFVVEIFH